MSPPRVRYRPREIFSRPAPRPVSSLGKPLLAGAPRHLFGFCTVGSHLSSPPREAPPYRAPSFRIGFCTGSRRTVARGRMRMRHRPTSRDSNHDAGAFSVALDRAAEHDDERTEWCPSTMASTTAPPSPKRSLLPSPPVHATDSSAHRVSISTCSLSASTVSRPKRGSWIARDSRSASRCDSPPKSAWRIHGTRPAVIKAKAIATCTHRA